MTDDQKRTNIAAEVARGESAFRSAELLLAAGQRADAVSRAYYAAFHYARALLLTLGEEARTHGGLDRLVQRDLVRTGKLAPETAAGPESRSLRVLRAPRHDQFADRTDLG